MKETTSSGSVSDRRRSADAFRPRRNTTIRSATSENIVHVVADEDHSTSAFSQAADELQDLARLRNRERRRRFIHDDEPRIEIERA